MQRDVRAALELMTPEIGQAGQLTFSRRTTSAALTASTSAQSVTLSSTTDIFVGEKLLIDIGSAQETVSVTALTSTSVTGIFAQNHASGAVVDAIGIFPQGVVYDTGLSAARNPTQLAWKSLAIWQETARSHTRNTTTIPSPEPSPVRSPPFLADRSARLMC